ncbi:type II secretion system protein [bacterium]|nr:type II secretion system protein [bacterium]
MKNLNLLGGGGRLRENKISYFSKFPRFNKNKAFTLAETLITLAVIGVVATLTIPTLQQKYTEHITVSRVKKFYSTISNAYAQAVNEHGPVDTWETPMTKSGTLNLVETLIKPYFKISKDCGFSNEQNCIPEITYQLNGTSQGKNYSQNVYTNYYKLMLEDGSSVWFRGNDDDAFISIFLDINGTKKPNQRGKDFFGFHVINNGSGYVLIPGGLPNSKNPFDKNCHSKSVGDGCTAWVIYKGNMEYLHCDDLKWNGKQKCSK